MFIEILTVNKKKDAQESEQHTSELKSALEQQGYTLKGEKKVLLQANAINAALNAIAKSDEKPDAVIVMDALESKDSTSFKKHFVETVAAAEHTENEPAPKDYWKKRNQAFKEAKQNNANAEEIKVLEEEFELTRKKAKVFSLGDCGNGYKGYAFSYRGLRVAVVPQTGLTGKTDAELAAYAAKKCVDVFENAEDEYPNGFSVQKYVPAKTGFANRFIPMRGDDKKEIIRKSVVIAAVLVFIGALWMLFYNMVFLSVKNAQLNGEIQKVAHSVSKEGGGETPSKGKDDSINWDELQKINKEIVGWIQINNTKIDYPVLWHKGDDAGGQYYLNHNYKGDYDSYGCIFLDYRCKNGMNSKNIVLHGHHMNDGSMFGNLLDYGGTEGNLDFYKKSPTVRLDTPEGNGTYKIISVYKTNTLSSHGEFFNYMVGDFQNEKDFMNYVYNVRVRSLINCPVDVNEGDEIITLSTCSYEYTNFRTVVVARKTRIGEDAKVDTSKASLNKNAVWPEVYYSTRGGTRPKLTDFCTAYENKQIDWYDGNYTFKDQKVVQPTTQSTTDKNKNSSSTDPNATEPVLLCSVTFINYDGSFIENQTVEYGKAAKAPADPVKPSDDYYDYVFKGWGLDFKKVTSDMIIAPIFEPKLKPEYTQAAQ